MDRLRFRTVACAATVTISLTLLMAATSQANQLPTLKLAVTKQNVTVTGQMVSGAVNIAITVSGEPLDNPGLILLKPGVTAAQFLKVVSSMGQNGSFDAIDAYGTLVFDSPDALKGSTTVTQAVLPPGNYIAVNNGNAHTSFTIAAASSPAQLPKPQASISAIEFGYTGSSTVHDGELVRFSNHGYLIHMVQAAKVASVGNAEKAEAALRAGKTSVAQKYAITQPAMWMAPISPGQAEQYVMSASPGIYVVFCSMTTQDGRPHYELGQYKTIKVVK